ncbi:hypothetical protein GOP47_0009875 [Adiantum capillus-veneris]|uniref:histidine kinase n=1 Tax=Adiantum capillus-veneris TaxID=13818 RepID=A0A9D4ZJE0_ADICA|nr:hypothetical protein GOP47_0009297 [Adiantum capillus-veneris]KAI5075799.1 hypothetical protein GOP47_0009875 [Adiantum capillus-veneris]
MEPSSPEAPIDLETHDKATQESIFGAIAAGKELSRKIVQGIQEGIGFNSTSPSPLPPTSKPFSRFSNSVKLVSGRPNDVHSIDRQGQGADGCGAGSPTQPASMNIHGKHAQKAISFFQSRHELGAPITCTANEALEEGLVIMTDRALRASILRQGLLIAFSWILTLVFCIMAVIVPSAQIAWTREHSIEEDQHTYIGGYWAMQLYGLLATCLCLLGFTWLGEWKRSWDCDCCHDEVQKTAGRAQEAEQKALQADGAKQQFMTYVFHNIRVPFNAIVLGLGYLRSKADKSLSTSDISENTDLIQMMLDCAETMTSVLDDVTDMGQWEDGAMELNVEEFDLLGLVKFLLWGLKDLLYQKQMRFSMSIDPDSREVLSSNHVLGDKHRVLQTLGNFLSNAVKFSPLGGKLELSIKCESHPCNAEAFPSMESDKAQDASLCPCLRVEGLRKQLKDGPPKPSLLHASCNHRSFAKVLITVKDNGEGISPQDQEKLFEPYSFVSSGWVQMAGVSGLGLSIAKCFAECAGGYIGVKSKEGEGSMFYFCLPYPLIPITHDLEGSKDKWLDAFMSEEPQRLQAQSTFGHRERLIEQDIETSVLDSQAMEKGGKKVLLVEDTEINRIILRKVLQTLQLSCEEAENGQIAVNLLKQGRAYDLILMDKEMPVMDGHEATRQIRLLGVTTPIVALTGNALQSDRKLFLEAGVDDFQTKPLSRDKLVQVLIRFGVEIPCV